MTWEQRWMRRMIKGLVWACALYLFAYLLEVTATWQVITLVIACNVVDDILDGWLPTLSDAPPAMQSSRPR